MSALHAAVLNAFKKAGWAYREVSGMEVVEAQFEAYHGKVLIHVQSFGETHIMSVVGNVSLAVPKSHRNRAAELLMRANKEMNLGNLEVDWDSGQVMFRQSQIFSPHRYDEEIITSLVHNAIAEVDRITPYVGVVAKTAPTLLPLLDVRALLLREDLLPPVPEDVETA